MKNKSNKNAPPGNVENTGLKANLMENKKEDLPGYPYYPDDKDIMEPSNATRLPVDVENVTRSGEVVDMAQQKDLRDDEFSSDPGLNEDLPGEADITKEDLEALGEKDQDMDMGEDEELRADRGGRPFDMTGEALDVPGAELDDANEEIGKEDEENNFYSRPD